MAAAIAGAVVFATVSGLYLFTTADVQARFLLDNPTGYLSAADAPDESDADLVFHREDVDMMNTVSSGSLGYSFFAHERMYCLQIQGNEVKDVRLADMIQESDFHAISGGCRDLGVSGELGLAHTHPRYNADLSEKDREIQRPFSVTCIQWDEIIERSGTVHGLRCFDVPEEPGGPDREFPELELAIVD